MCKFLYKCIIWYNDWVRIQTFQYDAEKRKRQLRLRPMLQLSRQLNLVLIPSCVISNARHGTESGRTWCGAKLRWLAVSKSTSFCNFLSGNFCRIRNTKISTKEMLFTRITQNCDNKIKRENNSVGIAVRLWVGEPVQICSIPVRIKKQQKIVIPPCPHHEVIRTSRAAATPILNLSTRWRWVLRVSSTVEIKNERHLTSTPYAPARCTQRQIYFCLQYTCRPDI